MTSQPSTTTILPAKPEAVPEARALAARCASEHGAVPSTLTAVRLAVTEAVTNAVMHAFHDGPAGEVRLVLEPRPDELSVIVADDGHGLRPRDDSPGLGLGLSLIAELADHLEIRAGSDGGTEVRMRFALAGP